MISAFQHLQLDRPLAVLDLESTGTDPGSARIVALALVKYAPPGDPTRFRHFGPAGTPVRFCHRVDPGCPIPAAATAVHGLGAADVAGCPRFRAIARQTVRFLAGCDLAGFGIRRFDLPLLAAEFDRSGVPFALSGRRIVDVLDLYHALHPRDLGSAYRYYCGQDHTAAHDALGDVLASASVLDALVGRHAELPPTVSGLAAQSAVVDVQGWLCREGSRLVLARGRYRGRGLDLVAAADAGYLRWLLRLPLLDDTRALVESALKGSSD